MALNHCALWCHSLEVSLLDSVKLTRRLSVAFGAWLMNQTFEFNTHGDERHTFVCRTGVGRKASACCDPDQTGWSALAFVGAATTGE